MKVIKRNGQEVSYDINKIKNAISKANLQTKELSDEKIDKIVEDIDKKIQKSKFNLSVEDIQDIAEKDLIKYNAYETSKEYITFRYKRSLTRNNLDGQILSLIEYENEEVKQENSNKNPRILSVQRDYMAGVISKDISERILLPKEIVQAHKEGIIHFHDMDYFAQHAHNCFGSNTKFVTNKGLKKFSEFKDGEKTEVLDKDGVWREATVRCYGEEPLYTITLQSCRTIKTIKATKNHRWLLKDGSITTNLQVGDRLHLLHKLNEEIQIETKEDALFFCLGFCIGDGSDSCSSSKGGLSVRLCGRKNEYSYLFEMAGFRKGNKKKINDNIYSISSFSKQDMLNARIWIYLNKRQNYMLYKGFYAADGNVRDNGVATTDERILEMIETISCIYGHHILTIKEVMRDTNYKKQAKIYDISFMTSQPTNRNWIVRDIQLSYRGGLKQKVWCIEEPVTKTFTLESGIVTGNCCLVNLEDMLQNGTVISGVGIDKPKSFRTACTIASQIVAQVASSQYGGQTISLSHLAPFVDVSRQKIKKELKEELQSQNIVISEEKFNNLIETKVKKEINDGIQIIQYQLITLQTTNGQAPFVSVMMYLNEVPENERDDLALLIESMLKQRIKGVKNSEGVYITPAFPKLLYVLQEDNIKKSGKYYYLTKLAAECTAKRMVPDYISEKIMLDLKGDVYPCMGCRSYLTPDRFTTVGKHKYYGRFNQGVVTLNLVDVALSSEKDVNKFWDLLEQRLELCHRALQERHKRLKGTLSDVAPIMWQYGALARLKPGQVIDDLLYHGYSTISLGYAGLYEMTKYMTNDSHTSEKGKEFALKVMQKLNDKCQEWKLAEDIDYSVYGSPIESGTYRFAKLLQKKFGIIEGITDKNYITNSYHISVTENIDAFSKLIKESTFQKLSPGGAISYVEVPNLVNNLEAVMSVLECIYENIQYAELNTRSDYCCECKFTGEIPLINEDNKLIWKCPKCGCTNTTKLVITRRTCGYIGTAENGWNQGRLADINNRVLHL
jgi:anaerobic ribonucleoside-triphosphate reductase